MSQFTEGSTRTFLSGGALGQYLRVKTPGALALAGASDISIGTTEFAVFAAGTHTTVRLRNAPGTRKMVASAAITAGLPVFASASGKVAPTGTILEGIALEAASGDGSIIEVFPLDSASAYLGGSVVQTLRTRFTTAQVNAGATVLPAVPGLKYRLVDAAMIAIGGAAATANSVDLLATQSTSSVKLVANAVAGLTQNTLLRAGTTNSAILAAGASFVQNDVNTAITIGKTGSDLATATHIDVLLQFEIAG